MTNTPTNEPSQSSAADRLREKLRSAISRYNIPPELNTYAFADEILDLFTTELASVQAQHLAELATIRSEIEAEAKTYDARITGEPYAIVGGITSIYHERQKAVSFDAIQSIFERHGVK